MTRSWLGHSMRRWWVWGLLLVFLLAILGSGWVFLYASGAMNLAKPDRARRQGQPIPVRTSAVTQSESDKVIGATAITVPSQRVLIRSDIMRGHRLSGGSLITVSNVAMKDVHVERGGQVNRGQLLFELDPKNYELIAKQWSSALAAAETKVKLAEEALIANTRVRELALASAETELKFHTANLENRLDLYEKMARLYADKVATEPAYVETFFDRDHAEYRKAEAKRRLQRATEAMSVGLLRDQRRMDQATAERDATRVGVELAQRNLQACQIHSPIDGVVNEVRVVPGQAVGVSSVLAELIDIDPIRVCMDFPQERIGEVTIGQSAEIVLDCFPKETFTGKVVELSAEVDPETRVLPVFIEMKNPGNLIKAGVSGFVRLRIRAKVAAVPATAVIEQDSKAMVFCVRERQARIREVVTGSLLKTGIVEVCKGLAPGDEVVIFGNSSLEDGDPVDTDWKKWARRK